MIEISLEHCIQFAGVIQLGIASANFVAIKLFHYRESLANVPEIIREVFIVQNVFLVFTLIGYSFLCFFFPSELAGATVLGRILSGFFALFWALRLAFQFFFYSREKKHEFFLINILFYFAFLYLVIVFSLGAIA